MIIAAIGKFLFNSVWGKALALAAGILALFSAWLWQHDAKVAAGAQQEFRVEVNKQAEKLHAKAVKARRPAAEPGAAERLRSTSCRDC